MPYIRQDLRDKVDPVLNKFLYDLEEIYKPFGYEDHDGLSNYVISKILNNYYSNKGYFHYNRAIGVLECVKQEYYRRRIAPYEDRKVEENGDIYE